MNPRSRKSKRTGVYILTLSLLASSLIMGTIYGGWTDEVRIEGSAKIGAWKPRLEIMKTLDGTFTDPKTGDPLNTPNRTHIAVAACWESVFKLTIKVRNTGGVRVHDITVIDVIENNVAPKDIQPSQGTYAVYSWTKKDDPWIPPYFGFNEVTWNLGTLDPGETAQMELIIGTLSNPSGKYEPTTGDEGDGQWIEFNRGAQATGYCFLGELRCWTTDLNLWVEDDGVVENKIAHIITSLPLNTPWGVDFY